MIKYEKAPYQQGYELALNNQKYKNPYRGENESADAEDFRRGFDNAKEEKLKEYKLKNNKDNSNIYLWLENSDTSDGSK